MSPGINSGENRTLTNMKQFNRIAREFVATHSEKSLNALNKLLMDISAADKVNFSIGRTEVNFFFSSLWETMSQPNGPHWKGIAALTKAVGDSSLKSALTHTYKFMPLLSTLLSDKLTQEQKIRLLTLMEALSYGIKINWQESYLANLMKILSAWSMTSQDGDTSNKRIVVLSLTVLVNLCYGNTSVIDMLMRTIDTRELIKYFVSLKDNKDIGVQLCRLLMSLQGAEGSPGSQDIHNFLGVTLKAFVQGIKDCDATQLKHCSTFLHDLCSDSYTKIHLISYEQYDLPIQEALQLSPLLLSPAIGEENKNIQNQCIQSTLTFFTSLVKLELYPLRVVHSKMADFGVKSSHISECLSSSLGLLACLVLQYVEDGMLPDDLMAAISVGLQGLLSPASLDSQSAGLQWLQLVSAMCDCNATQDAVLHNVNPEYLEDILHQILQTGVQNGTLNSGICHESVLIGCRSCLGLAQRNSQWDCMLNRMLSNSSVQRVLSSCLSSNHKLKRKQSLELIKHSHFPIDKLTQVFCGSDSQLDRSSTLNNNNSISFSETPIVPPAPNNTPSLTPSQELVLDKLIEKINFSLENNQVNDITVSSFMEMYSYKMSCQEQRLNAAHRGLQGATNNVASLHQSMALLEATNRVQQDNLYQSQISNEKFKENIFRLSEQLSDAEQSIRRFQGKLAAERLDREQQNANSQWEFAQKIKTLENELEAQNMEVAKLNAIIIEMESAGSLLQSKLAEQTTKNSELAGVLVKFEERVKQRDKKLEEANKEYTTVKNDLKHSQESVKTLEKTLLERDRRLTQVTTQLEEMNRIQEMIANLMGNKGSNNSTSSS